MGIRNVITTISLAATLTLAAAPGYAFSLSQMLGGGEEQDLNTFKVIHVADLKALLAARGSKVHVYDANDVKARQRFGTIPGATLLNSNNNYALSVLPSNKHATLVFYCVGPR
jgi:hypothetical protein